MGGSDKNQGEEPQLFLRRYTFKLYPNKTQAAALQRQATLLAHLWNAALEERETQWRHECQRKARGDRKGLSYFDQCRSIKELRKSDPEYAAISSLSIYLTLKSLDGAFQHFFRRARQGAGRAAGYPKFKSAFAIENKGANCTIWHGARASHQQPLSGTGWKFAPAGKNWSLYSKGVPGKITARGKFPDAPLDFRTAEIMRRGGVWQISVVAVMPARRRPGPASIEVEFDLIDKFAHVRANGEGLSGWEGGSMPPNERISLHSEGLGSATGSGTPETGADGKETVSEKFLDSGSDAPETAASKTRKSVPVDKIKSNRDRTYKKFSSRWRKETRRIAKLQAKEARRRKDHLHRWTTFIVNEACQLAVVTPDIKEHTKSARGTERNWGGAVKPVAALNRHVLDQAPAMAIQMLQYKAGEAGIPFSRVALEDHALKIGKELPDAVKKTRQLRRKLKKEKAA